MKITPLPTEALLGLWLTAEYWFCQVCRPGGR